MAKLQIVLVDDNPVDLELMERDLARLGADCVLLSSPETCLQFLEGVYRLPDLLITDVNMPGMDGFELLSALKQRYPALPIAIVTGHTRARMTAQALRLGAFDFLTKPVAPDELESICHRVQEFHEDVHAFGHQSEPVVSRTLLIRAETRRELSRSLSRDLCRQLATWIHRTPVDFLKVRVALIEAIENAVTHGNLEASLQRATLGSVAYEALLRERLQDEKYSQRKIAVEMHLDHLGVRITVSDEGPGFDPETLPESPEMGVSGLSGRGMFIIRNTFDRVSWEDEGRSVRMYLHLS